MISKQIFGTSWNTSQVVIIFTISRLALALREIYRPGAVRILGFRRRFRPSHSGLYLNRQ